MTQTVSTRTALTKPALPVRLLVVHPDGEARTFLRRRFTRLAHEVVEAADHAKVLALIATTPFNLVLLDLQTPGPDGETGLDLLRRIRETRSAADLPILAIGGEGAAEEAVDALALGADDCLLRPLYIDVAQMRTEMLLGRRGAAPAPRSARGELQNRIDALEEVAVRTEAVTAVVAELGRDVCASLNGLIGAASVLTAICQSPQLKRPIETIETAVAALDLLVVRALGRADRRVRAPKPKLRVLLADDDTTSRIAVHALLNAAEVQVELVEVTAGLQAALATDAQFFDLIVINVAAPEAIAGLREIRRAERRNQTRRTPILAFGAKPERAAPTRDAGADLYMRQPVTPESLLSALADALARQSEEMRAVA